jgi:hypothetical protein
LASGQPLILEWERAGGTAAVRLRAQGLRRRLYYRMDALSPPRARSFTWPSEILSALQIPRTDIGVTATTRDSVAGAERDLFLPLRVHQGATAPQPSGYRLVLLPGVELKEVFLTLTAASGDRRTVLKDGEPMGYGYYPAERPIEVPVAGPPAPGVYHLEIGATLKNGGAATVEFWFYHHGSQERRK